MQTFEQIQQQIVDLQKQADAMRKQAVAAAIKEVKRLVNLYNLGMADIGITFNSASKKATKAAKATKAKSVQSAKSTKSTKKSGDKRAAVAPKYRDSETGQTWTGRGKAPTWLAAKMAAGASKESFKI